MRQLFLLTWLAACQTSGPKHVDSPESIFASDVLTEFSFATDESLWVHKRLLDAEAAKGSQHNLEMFHSLDGRIQCERSGKLQSCYTRARYEGTPFLSAKSRMEPEVSARLLKFFTARRAALKDASTTVVGVRCDHKGPKLPPYGTIDIKCHLDQPRLPDEAVFEDFAAEKLFLALKGERPTGTQVTATGDIWCETSACQVRPREPRSPEVAVQLSAFDVKAQRLEPETSAELLSRFETASEEAWAIAVSPSDDFAPPLSYKGPVWCESTLHAIKSGTMRRYFCRVTLQQ